MGKDSAIDGCGGFRFMDCELVRQCARHAGYGLCVAWGFLLFSIVEFHTGSGFETFAWSAVPGCVACLVLLAASRRVRVSARRSGLAFCAALFASVGTFAYVSPLWSGAWIQYVGLALAGVSFIGLLASWFVLYARLSARAVFLSSGFALAIASIVCVAVSALDYEEAGLCLALLPVASCLFLPAKSDASHPENAASGSRPVAQIIKAAIPFKTILGLLLVYFVIDSLRGIGRLPGSFLGIADATFLVVPVGMSCVCALVACLARNRVDLGVLCKVVLAAFSISLALIVVAVRPTYRFGFATSVCTQILCWMLLVFVAKKSPVHPVVIFSFGWIAEFIGGFLAQAAMPCATALGTVVPFALALIMAASTVFIFSDESLVIEIDCEDFVGEGEAQTPTAPTLLASEVDESGSMLNSEHAAFSDAVFASTAKGRIVEFARNHGLTPRESEVFALWITGHGMKDIQEELFVSQGTVKTHLRNIYDKCDVHSRRDLMKLFEG